MTDDLTDVDRSDLGRLTLTLVETCIRNTGLENLHAGRFPCFATGDFSDVRVVTPEGDIAWTELSRISDAEMKTLMIEVVDRVFSPRHRRPRAPRLAGMPRTAPVAKPAAKPAAHIPSDRPTLLDVRPVEVASASRPVRKVGRKSRACPDQIDFGF